MAERLPPIDRYQVITLLDGIRKYLEIGDLFDNAQGTCTEPLETIVSLLHTLESLGLGGPAVAPGRPNLPTKRKTAASSTLTRTNIPPATPNHDSESQQAASRLGFSDSLSLWE